MANLPRPTLRQLKLIVPIIALALLVLATQSIVPEKVLDSSVRFEEEIVASHPCSDWDPDASPDDEPQDCLRARQYRELERLLEKEATMKHLSTAAFAHNLRATAQLRRCLRNEINCPSTPVIISGWWYLTESVSGKNSTTGEVIWMKSVVEQFEESGYLLLATNGYTQMVTMTKLIPSLVHQVWTEDRQVISCATDPRCIMPAHYRPPENATSLLDPDDPIPESEAGVIPLWKLHAADYWGSRPASVANTDHYWGRPGGDSTPWSFNPLGSEWTIVPYKYPGHACLPFSIERICTTIPWVEHRDRQKAVLVLAKKSSYFYEGPKHRYTPPEVWERIKDSNVSYDFLSTANIDPPRLLKVPEGIKDIGFQTRLQYEKLVGSVQVLLGIGRPTISPSVYTALCQGTPIVLPHFKDDPTPPGWALYSEWTSQHGPALALGEPWAYSYRYDDAVDMQSKVQKAIDNPIGRYIPPEMKWEAAVSGVKRYLDQNWQAKFIEIVSQHGDIPRMLPNIRERCFHLNRCYFIEPEPREGKVYDGASGGWTVEM